MKKIRTITYSKTLNYGAFLQCYALLRALTALGYDVGTYDYHPSGNIDDMRLFKTNTLKIMAKSALSAPIKWKKVRAFKRAFQKINTVQINDPCDVAVTGSDQVWNPQLSGNMLDPYFALEKIDAKRKVSYAASIGNEDNVGKYKNDFRRMIEKLDAISVREEKAKNALSKITKRDIQVTIDPTGLLSKAEWEYTISDYEKDKNRYIFSYFIGIRQDQKKVLAKISKKTRLKVTSYSSLPKESYIYKRCYSDGPFEFLARLRDAKLVITSSFHGTILSIIFHKNFYVLMPDPKKRSRMDNILKLTGLTNRIIETEADIDKINLEDIDYTEPQKKLDKLRQESLDWLKNAMGD